MTGSSTVSLKSLTLISLLFSSSLSAENSHGFAIHGDLKYSKDFKHLKIQLPSLPEQQKIAEVLSLVDDEINLLKNELEELKKAFLCEML